MLVGLARGLPVIAAYQRVHEGRSRRSSKIVLVTYDKVNNKDKK